MSKAPQQELQEALFRAATLHQDGMVDEAREIYERVLALDANNPEANHNLGILAMQTGRGLQVALPLFKRSWLSDPTHEQHWQSYIRALVTAGHFDAVNEVFADGQQRGLSGPDPALLRARQLSSASANTAKDSTDLDPVVTQILLRVDQDPAAAEREARDLLKNFPDSWLAWKALGLTLCARKQDSEAIYALETAARLSTTGGDIDPVLWSALASLSYDNGMYHEAKVAAEKYLLTQPDEPGMTVLLAKSLLKLNQISEARALCLNKIAVWPTVTELHLILAQTQLMEGRDDDAMETYRRALKIDNGLVTAYQELGKALFAQEQYEEVLALCDQMIAARPEYHSAHSDRGTALQACGRMSDAMASYQRAIELEPKNLDARSNWLFCSNYCSDIQSEAVHQNAVAFGHQVSANARPFTQWTAEKIPTQLRVGLVSGDLREHPVGFFLESVTADTHSAIDWFAYSSVSKADALTERLKNNFAGWKILAGMNIEDSARAIHEDGLHVLIDLSGHTAHNLLPVFSWRPAPIQVSWLGYFSTTGIAEIDYFLADMVSLPTSEQRYYSEAIWPITDTRLCFSAPDAAPDVAAPPCVSRGFITFGSFQKLPKISDETLAVWGEVLGALPDSRLRLQCGGLDDENNREALTERALANGIAPERLDLYPTESRERYLASHADVDIILDTFPFSGGTTTCEALWMGVPTLTLEGKRLVSRQGASLMTAAGLGDWVASSEAEYVDMAVSKAADFTALSSLRANLREQLRSSALCDSRRFVQNLSTALWEMWKARSGNETYN